MKESSKKQFFFKHPGMNFETLIALGACDYGGGEPGEIFSTVSRIKDGDFENWFSEWLKTAERVRAIGEKAAADSRTVSAADAFLRAANYFAAANTMVDGSDDPSRLIPVWKQHRDCFERFASLISPPAVKVSIPYEETAMPGYLFLPEKGPGPFPTVIFNNGSDGSISSMWGGGIAGARKRGYAALIFDGPGQNALLWLENIPFRYDWEKVITPVVDFLLRRDEIDGERIALSGWSQGGYWILRALAFEKRIAAGIADPGVMDVAAAMKEKFGHHMLKLLEAGEEEKFNKQMKTGLKFMGKAARREVAFRMKPYGTDNYFEWITKALKFNCLDVIDGIECPIFISDPEDEQFWPGQSREVYEALQCPKTIVEFTAAEGANRHCEPMARRLYDQRMFDWLATVMPAE